jgi:hypothetical protein
MVIPIETVFSARPLVLPSVAFGDQILVQAVPQNDIARLRPAMTVATLSGIEKHGGRSVTLLLIETKIRPRRKFAALFVKTNSPNYCVRRPGKVDFRRP